MHSVVGLPLFVAQAERLFSPQEKDALIDLLSSDPQAGVVIPGTGGVRKLRVAASGRGKRGGARVIHFYGGLDLPVFAIAVYAKADKDDLTADEKRAVTALARLLKQTKGR